ncbi:MAG: DoxX family protein [Candidatus Dormibacteria bacterium]
MKAARQRILHIENHIHHQLVMHGITALRIVVGAIFLGFGLLKYFPGVSPAQNLTETTMNILLFGLVPGRVAVVMAATLECFIGISLLSGRGMRVALWLLGVEFIGILSPLILLTGRLFAGPYHAPTLEGQYVLKDVILVAAGLVIAAGTFRGGRMVRDDLAPASPPSDDVRPNPEKKLGMVLDSISDDNLISELCERNHISESEFHEWRKTALAGATKALGAED